jgi:ABC-2 type transport system permease protein
MNAPLALSPSQSVRQPPRQASFTGMMRGEYVKITHLFWPLLAILIVAVSVVFGLGASASGVKTDLQTTPLHFLYTAVESNLVVFRICSGLLLLVLTSCTIGWEYQYGTIRIVLARGAGRVQLLLAKLAVLALLSLVLLGGFLLVTALLICVQMFALAGNLNALQTLTPAFWSNTGIDLLTVIINLGATILLAAAMNALGRSLTVGLSASLIWFPLDNVGTLLMNTLARVTHSDVWLNATAYVLGPLLNRLPDMLLPTEAQSGFQSFGVKPLVSVSGSHAVFVIGVYSLVFLLLALLSTWKRDVKE